MQIDLIKLFNPTTDLNKNMLNVIIKALKEGHEDEMDYLKFKHSVNTLQAMDMDEATSIRSAFATLQSMGVTKKMILDSIQKYAIIVEKEKEKFAIALKNQITNQIEKPQLEAGKFDEMIADKERKIAKLQREIEAIKNRKETIGDDIAKAEVKINGTRDEFRSVYEFIAKSIDNDKILMDQLLS